MKKHTLQFKNKIKEFGRQLDSKITYELNGEQIELGNEKLNSVTPTFQSKILKSAMKQLDIDSNEDIPLNTEINYKFGTLIDNDYEYIDYGNYIVYSSEKQEDTDSYKIVCYDKMLYSMVNYEGLRNGSFPMTVKEFLQNICKDLYIDFKDSEFANKDRIIETDLYKDLGYTYRDVLDELSEVTASTICINDNDELEVRYIDYASYDNEVTGETINIEDNEGKEAKELTVYGNLETKPILPSEYQQVEYIESTGTQYIDTNYFPNSSLTKIEIDFAFTDISHVQDRLFFTEPATSTTLRVDCYINGNGYYAYNFNNVNNNISTGIKANTNKRKIILDGYKKKVYLDNLYSASLSNVNNLTATSPLILFAMNAPTSTENISKTKLYNLKIYESEILIKEFVPCYRKADNVIGLYDLVENKFYINNGTGTFLKGISIGELPSEYQQVEYIESTGTQYIDTGIKPNNNTRIEAEILFNQDGGLQYGSISNKSEFFLYGLDANGKIILYIKDNKAGNYQTNDKLIHKYILDAKNNFVSLDGKKQTVSSNLGTFENNILLFKRHNYNNGLSKCYKHSIYDNEILIQDLIPCYRKNDGVIGMYDLVENKFYTNSGTGVFLKGSNITIPSPNYPQKIEVVNGVRNLFAGGDSATINGIKFTKNNDGSYNITGTSTQEADCYNYVLIKDADIINGKTYTLSVNQYLPNGVNVYVEAYDGTTWIRHVLNETTLPVTSIANITNATRIKFTIRVLINRTVNISNLKIQLEEGNIANPYMPYGSNYLINKITGKNLLEISGNTTSYGITSNYEKGIISFSGTTTNTWSDFTKTQNCDFEASTYTFSIDKPINENVTIRCIFEDNTYHEMSIYKSQTKTTHTFTKKIVKYRLHLAGFSSGKVIPQTTIQWQFEKGNQATKWEESKQTIIINYDLQNNFLAKIDNTYDELDETNGVLTKIIEKTILDGSERITIDDGRFRIDKKIGVKWNDSWNKIKIVSNYFVSSTFNTIKNGNNRIACHPYDLVPEIYSTDFTTTTEFQNWLKDHPVTIYYILSSSETIQLAPTQIPLFKGTNNISLKSNIPTQITLKYTNEIDTIDEEYLKDVNVNFGEKYGPVNSIVLSRAAESDNVYIQDEESIEKNGLTELKIIDNQIMNFNDRSDYLPELLEKLNGLEYYLNDFSSTGICYYDICDKYRIKVFDNTYECVMFNDEVNITQGLEENVYTEMPEETETDYTKADKTDQRINRAYLIVDKQNQTIEALTSKTENIEQTENNNYQYLLEKFQSVDESISKIENIEHSVVQLQTDTYTKTEVNQIANGIGVDGQRVTAVITTSGTFDENGMTYEKTNAKTKTTINEIGINVKDSYDKSLLFAGYVDENNADYQEYKNQTIVGTDNVIVRNYLNIGQHSRMQDYENGTGIFYRGGNY